MLVLSRKPGQEIVVGDNVRVTVLEVRRGVVRLGIEAPREIPVVRTELLHDYDEPRHRPVPEAA